MLSSLLNSTSEPAHASSPGSARLSSPGKQNSVPWSPRASRSPVKHNDASLDAHSHGNNAGASSASPSTPSRAALGNLIHATDQAPRATPTPTPNGDHATTNNNNNNNHHSPSQTASNEHPGNSSNTLDDGDVTMDDAPDEDLVEAAMRGTAEMSDEGEGEDDDDEEDDDDDDDDDEDSEDEGDDSDSSEIIVVDGPNGEGVADSSAVIRVKSEPADGAAAAAAAADGDKATADEDGEVVNVLQPKKKGKRRARSESEDEDLPPPPPPMPTIRLDVSMNPEEDTLDWNFAEHAAAAGYQITNAWGEDPLAQGDVVMAEGALGDDSPMPPASAPPDLAGPLPPGMNADEAREMEEIARRLEEKYDKPGKRKTLKKRRVRVEYDLNDPFIDDSDLQIDAPTHVARPKKEGFFVHLGALELMEESPVKRKYAKPKAPRNTGVAPRQSLSTAVREKLLAKGHTQHGSAQSPIPIDSDDETPPSIRVIKRSPSPEASELDRYPVDRTLYKNASREPKYLPPFDEFPDDVRHYLMSLRRESSKHVWDPHNKGKFPDHLKTPLKRAGEAAFQHDLLCTVDKEAQDTGFDKFQEKAFVTALCSILPYNRLTLGKLVLKLCYHDYWRWLQANETEGLRQWKEILDPEIPAMVQAYEEAVEAHKNATGDAPPAEQVEDLHEGGGKKEREAPKKLPFFSPELRELYRQLVENTQEMVDINKKMEEWGQKIEGQSSELNMRRALYNKIGKLYPEGYMTSLTLSRQFTNFKRQAQSKAAGETGDK